MLKLKCLCTAGTLGEQADCGSLMFVCASRSVIDATSKSWVDIPGSLTADWLQQKRSGSVISNDKTQVRRRTWRLSFLLTALMLRLCHSSTTFRLKENSNLPTETVMLGIHNRGCAKDGSILLSYFGKLHGNWYNSHTHTKFCNKGTNLVSTCCLLLTLRCLNCSHIHTHLSRLNWTHCHWPN